MRQHIATCAMHVLSPHLRICGDFRNGVIHLAHKIRGRLFAVLEVPIDSKLEFCRSFGVKPDFSYASH